MTINLDEIIENEPIVIILDGVAKTFYKPQIKIYGKKHKLCRRGGKEMSFNKWFKKLKKEYDKRAVAITLSTETYIQELKEAYEEGQQDRESMHELQTENFRFSGEIKALGERCNQLIKDEGDLTDKVKELEAQIEKMKNCKNCKKLKKEKDGLLVCTVGSFYTNTFGKNCDKWEIKENE